MHTSSHPTGDATAAATNPVAPHVREVIEQAVRQGVPGMVAQTRDGHRTCWSTAGVADVRTGRTRVPQERFRIGSVTKVFTAAVVLQLAAEHKLSLDNTVDRWLPGLLQGNGHDGSRITVRHLLRQTSGIFPYSIDPAMLERFFNPGFLTRRFDRMKPEQLVKIAVSHPAQFQPGESWAYSNTNYILAGMIAERADGRPFATQLVERITRPLRLTGTYMPGDEAELQGVHPRHYSKNTADGSLTAPVHDVTEQNAGHDSHAWTAGGMVSTAGDLDRFLTALLRGQFLPPQQQHEMFTTTEVPPQAWIDGATYGSGIFSMKLPNGRTVWGVAGMINGCYTFAMGDREGRRTIVTHLNGDWAPADWPSGIHLMTDVVAAELG
ncbi:serine hydrolase domain-containing protein [Microtetraspora malaysiensis]|uniref:Serine hydrolase domain-containing protein n=1 Tax=Microtetraspora malaysiensis TaxID=161358 RepID=A0ABW6SL07_9ACTN